MLGKPTACGSTFVLPKARLASIASFETIPESYDLSLDADKNFRGAWFDSAGKESRSSATEPGSNLPDSGATESSPSPSSEGKDGDDVTQIVDLMASSVGFRSPDKPTNLMFPIHLGSGSSVETLTHISSESRSASTPDSQVLGSAQCALGLQRASDCPSQGGIITVNCDSWKTTKVSDEASDNQLDALALSPGTGANRHHPLSALIPSGQHSSGAMTLKRCSVVTMKEGQDTFSALRSKSGNCRTLRFTLKLQENTRTTICIGFPVASLFLLLLHWLMTALCGSITLSLSITAFVE